MEWKATAGENDYPADKRPVDSVFFLFAFCDQQHDDSAECDKAGAGIEPDIEIVTGLGITGLNGELLDLELPVEVADGVLELVTHLERNAQRYIELDIGAGIEGAEADPVFEGRFLVGGSVKENGLAILLDGEVHLLEEFD